MPLQPYAVSYSIPSRSSEAYPCAAASTDLLNPRMGKGESQFGHWN